MLDSVLQVVNRSIFIGVGVLLRTQSLGQLFKQRTIFGLSLNAKLKALNCLSEIVLLFKQLSELFEVSSVLNAETDRILQSESGLSNSLLAKAHA